MYSLLFLKSVYSEMWGKKLIIHNQIPLPALRSNLSSYLKGKSENLTNFRIIYKIVYVCQPFNIVLVFGM